MRIANIEGHAYFSPVDKPEDLHYGDIDRNGSCWHSSPGCLECGMSKLDDIIGAYMVDVDLHGFIAEEEVPPCKREIKALMLEVVGEDEPIVNGALKYDAAYKDGRNNLRAELRVKVNAL